MPFDWQMPLKKTSGRTPNPVFFRWFFLAFPFIAWFYIFFISFRRL